MQLFTHLLSSYLQGMGDFFSALQGERATAALDYVNATPLELSGVRTSQHRSPIPAFPKGKEPHQTPLNTASRDSRPLGRVGEGLPMVINLLPLGEGWDGATICFFTANGGVLILLLVSLPVGSRGGGWWRISESPLSGISTTTRRRIGRSPEKEQNFLYHLRVQ